MSVMNTEFLVTPVRAGRQLVRVSLPFSKGTLPSGGGAGVTCGGRRIQAAVRELTLHPAFQGQVTWVRRGMVTFPYSFSSSGPVSFEVAAEGLARPETLPVEITVEDGIVRVTDAGGAETTAHLLAPRRESVEPPRMQTVESNEFFVWRRFHLDDPVWPRVIEVRADCLGTVVLVAHLQRNHEGDGRAPDFGWEAQLDSRTRTVYHPSDPLKKRGAAGWRNGAYQYLRCAAADRVPMQQSAWQRAEMVIATAGLAPLTPTLEHPHHICCDFRLWDELYGTGQPLSVDDCPEIADLVSVCRENLLRASTRGDDWGNVTEVTPDGEAAIFGMNRLNHCPDIYFDGYRDNDPRLVEMATLWCDNFHDQTIWWGPDGTGGTRYPNVSAVPEWPRPEDALYMWRSNSAVHFCAKGFESFLIAYEQTGDPRMLEALDAQVAYTSEHVHAAIDGTRNIGVVRDFVRLYDYTGRQHYLEQALRLFRELREVLSTGDLFTESGKPIVPDPAYIDVDAVGVNYPFAKPYILGYALQGLPGLARHCPNEPKLVDVIRSVADFLAEAQDPAGGWRYPHPRSSLLHMVFQEHAWQLVQADLLLGPQSEHLDAIERYLRQRIWVLKKAGRLLTSVRGWEVSTGLIKESAEMMKLYAHPEDRDPSRDYTEGELVFSSHPPESLIYLKEIVRFYLGSRDVSRLLEPPDPDGPLGRVLARIDGPTGGSSV